MFFAVKRLRIFHSSYKGNNYQLCYFKYNDISLHGDKTLGLAKNFSLTNYLLINCYCKDGIENIRPFPIYFDNNTFNRHLFSVFPEHLKELKRVAILQFSSYLNCYLGVDKLWAGLVNLIIWKQQNFRTLIWIRKYKKNNTFQLF